jgi:integrase
MQKKLDDRTVRNLKPAPSGRLEIWDRLLPGFGLRITPNDARTYFVMYRTGFGEGRKQRRYRIGDAKLMSLGEAREAARKVLGKVEKGVDPAAERVSVQGVQATPDSFAAVATAYLDRYVKKNCRPSTYRETARIFNVDLIPAWGARAVTSISRRDVEAMLDGIAGRGAEVQANRVLARLRTFFNWTVDREHLATSPVQRMKPPTRERSRDRVLSDDEIRWFWQAASELGWPFGGLLKLLLLSAQRRDEIAGMGWGELDFERRVWTIPRERAKNDKPNDVALSELALEVINGLPEVDKRLVFTSNGRTHVSGFSKAKAKLDRLMNAARRKELGHHASEGEVEPWILHDLRRSAASGMARLNVPPHVVDKILNHVSGTIAGVGAVYNRHAYEPERSAALEAWGSPRCTKDAAEEQLSPPGATCCRASMWCSWTPQPVLRGRRRPDQTSGRRPLA